MSIIEKIMGHEKIIANNTPGILDVRTRSGKIVPVHGSMKESAANSVRSAATPARGGPFRVLRDPERSSLREVNCVAACRPRAARLEDAAQA